jgi:hypothetical protein
LKYSQLIQILRINRGSNVPSRVSAPNGPGINCGTTVRNGAKAASRSAKATFAGRKSRLFPPAALYAALTLSRSSSKITVGQGSRLAKP